MKSGNEVLLAHGGGGQLTEELIAEVFIPAFSNETLNQLGDSARLPNVPSDHNIALTTDSYVVQPPFFPGGDIGRLAVCGTVNDLAMVGAQPKYLTCGMILEEGFSIDDLKRVVASMSVAAQEAGVSLVAGDTKVVPHGSADKIFINTSGVGWIPKERTPDVKKIQAGDAIIISGTIGDHGTVVMATRENLGMHVKLESDTAPLNGLVEELFKGSIDIHAMRDPTRGGLAQTLCEMSKASGLHMELNEAALPVKKEVTAIADILGLDILQIANEGKLVMFVPDKDADKALRICQAQPLGCDAAIIGRVSDTGDSMVSLQTRFGGNRIVEQPMGELLPRIC